MIEEEKLQQNALDVGTYLLKGFETLRDKYDVIGDVRGKVSTREGLSLILF